MLAALAPDERYGSIDVATRPSGSRRKRRILIVEDHEDTRTLFQEHFDRAGYVVETATNGNEAVAAALRARPDVILLDLAMPALDGADTLTVLRSYPTTVPIPVVVCTGSAELLKKMGVSPDAVVEKPCLPLDVERVIDGVLRPAPESSTG